MTTVNPNPTANPGRKVAMLADVAAERCDLADHLETLDDAAWSTPSLCEAWTVHEVLAHLTLSITQKVAPTLWRVLKSRGDYARAEADMARDHAATHPPAALIALLRRRAGLDSRFMLGGRLDPLADILVHGQDIARPLGHHRPMPPHRVVPALGHVWGSGFYGGRGRVEGLRFTATDTDWTRGTGPEVRATAGDLLLFATGRRAARSGLTGPGAAEAAKRLP